MLTWLIWLAVVAGVAMVAPLFVFYVLTLGRISTVSQSLPPQDVAIVLGASVGKKTGLSPILEGRARAALTLYQTGKVSKILISGDNRDPSYDEVTPVRARLIKDGVREQDIMLDPLGVDTYSSMHRAATEFNVSGAIIVTQRFHLPRAVFLARTQGVDAYGYAAPGGQWGNLVREMPAAYKALLDTLLPHAR